MSVLHMYSPMMSQCSLSLLQGAITELHKSRTTTGDNNDDKTFALGLQTIEEISEKCMQIGPLEILCRLKIREIVTFKDVEKLPVPPNIINNLRIGNIPETHVIHQIIAEMKDETTQ